MTPDPGSKRQSGLFADPSLIAALSYIGGAVTGLAVLWAFKKNDLVRFHAIQSIVFSLVVSVVVLILTALPLVGRLAGMIGIAFFVVPWGYMMWKALDGERYKLPFIADFDEHQMR
jgi:uncharacterized membrane protein